MKANQKGSIPAVLAIIVLIAFAVWLGFYVHKQDKTVPEPATSNSTTSPGNSDQDLNSDLQNINNGLNQSDQGLQNSNNALNDQQQPITE